MKDYEDCKQCKLKECPEECFNSHEGSIIAVRKLMQNHANKIGSTHQILTDNFIETIRPKKK